MFGRTVSGFGSKAKRGGGPLSATIDPIAPFNEIIDVVGSATGSVVTFTNQGGFDVSVVASGGTGAYTYNWQAGWLDEISDTYPNNPNPLGSPTPRFSINSTGTTNTPRYNTLTIDGARPASDLDAPFEAFFTVRCIVFDGVSAVVVPLQFIANGVTIP
jgi:hypothetical protein|tara:strand:- start:865 stop:1341 length:477 start_codon:yes stop_codon:yes gene_type:complete